MLDRDNEDVEDRAIRYLESRGIVKDSKRNEILIVVRRVAMEGKGFLETL
jgi:hypothetical protein